MKPIAENTYDFAELRETGAVYVDKTGMLRDLITYPGRKLYFVARPRRFGKSLMISTLRYIFEGRRDLFEGLEIAKTRKGKAGYDWKKYPVLHFSFSGVTTSSLEEFKKSFSTTVARSMARVGLTYDDSNSPGDNFAYAIQTLRQNSDDGIVLLIDEYDAPIGHSLGKYDLANDIRAELSNFYIQIKENENCVRFMMMTGVTQFAKMSVFSALSNLTDLSLETEAAALLGYTKAELKKYFRSHMRAHAKVMQLDEEAYIAKLKSWCDGYHFSMDTTVDVFNPVAIGINMARREKNFHSAWAETGHSTILMDYVSTHALASMDYESIPNIERSELNSCSLRLLPATTVLYQSGYLTIREYDEKGNDYTLGVPNDEVRKDLARLIVYSQKGEVLGGTLFRELAVALRNADFVAARKVLEVLYAGLTYGSKEDTTHEAPYQRVLQIILAAGGFHVQSEVQQAVGRADVVAFHPCGNFVFELKVDKPVELAIDQIREKDYTLPYQIGEIPLYAVGLAFDSKTRNVKDMQVVRVR